MNDPHVEKLYYRFISENPNDRFVKAQPLTKNLESFDIEIRDGILIASPHDHYPDELSAKAAFEPVLKSWESSAFLGPNRFRIRFKFDHAEIIDRNPTPGVITIHAHSVISAMTVGKVNLLRDMTEYPEPPIDFLASPLTDELIYRLRQYSDGRKTLPQLAFYVLERLEEEFVQGKVKNKRKKLEGILNIDHEVLDNLGKLSNKPDAKIGRHASCEQTPISDDELHWMDEVIFRLVKRVGEVKANSTSLPTIRMSDFPQLT